LALGRLLAAPMFGTTLNAGLGSAALVAVAAFAAARSCRQIHDLSIRQYSIYPVTSEN